jgi:hypothetical protein
MPSFEEDVAAAVEVLGLHAGGVIFGLGMTPWESAEQRDAFLTIVQGRDGLGEQASNPA